MTASCCPTFLDTKNDMLTDIVHELYLDQDGLYTMHCMPPYVLILVQPTSQV